MVSHLVIMKPRQDLSAADRERLVVAFEHAIQEIPSVRNVRVGRRVKLGVGYEALMPDAADYFILIEFDDIAALAAYLQHPAHKDLGDRFNDSLAAALVFDYEDVGLDRLREL